MPWLPGLCSSHSAEHPPCAQCVPQAGHLGAVRPHLGAGDRWLAPVTPSRVGHLASPSDTTQRRARARPLLLLATCLWEHAVRRGKPLLPGPGARGPLHTGSSPFFPRGHLQLVGHPSRGCWGPLLPAQRTAPGQPPPVAQELQQDWRRPCSRDVGAGTEPTWGQRCHGRARGTPRPGTCYRQEEAGPTHLSCVWGPPIGRQARGPRGPCSSGCRDRRGGGRSGLEAQGWQGLCKVAPHRTLANPGGSEGPLQSWPRGGGLCGRPLILPPFC